MDNIILGLLLMQSRTIYQLRERIGKGIHLMYSSSMGSIQAAIRKLLDRGLIEYDESAEGGRHKKIYRITESGRQRFLDWVSSPIADQNPKNPELAKVYFMGFASEGDRIASIEHHLGFLREQHAILDAICQDAKKVEVDDAHKDILAYQVVCARYGRDLVKFNLDWYERLLREMEDDAL